MLKFAEDLYNLEYNIIKNAKTGKFIIVDYGVKQNPLHEAA